MANLQEVVIHIHGISPDPKPGLHTGQYRAMHQAIGARIDKGKPWPNDFVGIEWGRTGPLGSKQQAARRRRLGRASPAAGPK